MSESSQKVNEVVSTPLTAREWLCGVLAVLAPVIGIALVGLFCGCKEVQIKQDSSPETLTYPQVEKWWK